MGCQSQLSPDFGKQPAQTEQAVGTTTPQNAAGRAPFIRGSRNLLGEAWVQTGEDLLADYGSHTLPTPDVPPEAVLYPSTTEEVRGIVALANAHRIPLFPISAGQNIGLGSRAPSTSGQVVVDLGRRMNRVIEVNEELGYCVIEPGVTFQAMYDELQQRGSGLMISPTAGPPLGSLLGNALEKGGGSGAYGDHFGMSCGMEVVLGNGDTIRTGEGGFASLSPMNWHTTKYSFGPALDGLFTQSNYGIVTRMGMWLMQRPPAIRAFFFTFPDDEDLGEILNLIRPLKANNSVPTLIRATSDLYLLSSQESDAEYVDSGGSRALSEEGRRALQAKYGVGAWTVSGALYGASAEALAPAMERLRQHFGRSGKARYISHEEAEAISPLHVALNSNAGKPAAGELRMLQWRPGGGATWFTPGLPMIGPLANDLQRKCREVCRENGLDYMASNVCGLRFARAVHAIIYNRENPDEAARADRCYRAMSAVFSDKGVYVGRAPTAYQEFHHRQRSPEVIAACDAIKRALDPNGIIAPGRYGMH